jgi:hypothetical protein
MKQVNNGNVIIKGVSVGATEHKISDIGRATTPGRGWGAGKSWEWATNPYVRGGLSHVISKELGAPANLIAQQVVKACGLKRIPDWMQTLTLAPAEGPPTIHVVEQTLITDLDVSSGDKFSWHKRTQIPGTIHLLRLMNRDWRIVYHVVVPIAPSEQSLKFLADDVKSAGGDVTVIFRILQS